jgi:hypothetical protein
MRIGTAKAYISLIKFHGLLNDVKAKNLAIATWLIFSCIVSVDLQSYHNCQEKPRSPEPVVYP